MSSILTSRTEPTYGPTLVEVSKQRGVIVGEHGRVKYVRLPNAQYCSVCQQATEMAVCSKTNGLLGQGYLRICQKCLGLIRQLDPEVFTELPKAVEVEGLEDP